MLTRHHWKISGDFIWELQYEILSVSSDMHILLCLRVESELPRTGALDSELPCTRALNRLTQSKRKVKYRIDGEWECSASSGILIKKEVIK